MWFGVFSRKFEEREREFADDYYGADISDEGIKIAKEKGIITKKVDLNKRLPFTNNFFDIVYCAETLEHVYNTDNLVSEICRILKPNGELIIATPNLASWYNRILLLLGICPFFHEVSIKDKTMGKKIFKKILDKEPSGHIRIFTMSSLKDILEMNNFKIMKKRTFAFWELPTLIKEIDILMQGLKLSSTLYIIAKKRDI